MSCTENTPRLTDKEITNYLTLFPDWQLKEGKLERQVKVKDFREALKLANRIGEIADQENHHPDLLVSWGLLKIIIYTHAVQAMTENDFILAAKIQHIVL